MTFVQRGSIQILLSVISNQYMMSLNSKDHSLLSFNIFVMIKNAEKQFIYRTYVKVSAMQKLQLISLVFQEEWKIKKAASFLYINYASAKSIILKHRKNSIQKKMPRIPEVRRCHYKKMINGKHNYNILCLKGGIFQNLLENLSQK